MSKKLFLLFALIIAGFTRTQAQLVVTNITSYDVVDMDYHVLINCHNVTVKNTDSLVTFNDSLHLVLSVEYPPGVYMNAAATNVGIYTILPLDSVVLDTATFDVDTSYLKDGNNTVVIWPYGTSGFYTAVDSFPLIIYVNLGTAINEPENEISIKAGPNPTNDFIFLYDPQTILQRVRVNTLDGKRVPVKFNGNVVDTSKLPEGIYVLEIETTRGTISRKIVMQR
ncbi:MAG TPA: T9SS type A sorting domain-containing protein [Flavobacteriales bacterium]|nr:T9SS type A sorting domain-containing protein [Flavobacteriales bacterium]